MRLWLATAGSAARLVADRAELWIPASLAALAFAGWLPLALAVVPLPDAAGLAFFGSGLVTSGWWPWNVLLLSMSAVLGIMTLCLLVALGETALQRGLRPLIDDLPESGERHGPGETLAGETAVTLVIILVALLPAAVAVSVLAIGVAAIAPGEYQSPDIGGPLLVRIASGLAPLMGAVVLCTILGQAFGSSAQRRAAGPHPEAISAAFAHAARDLRQRPGTMLGTALVTLAALATLTTLATLLLRVLWAPIGTALRAGELASPQTVLLLVGFVAIWLCLVLAGGALHAWASAWWSLELREHRSGRIVSEPGEPDDGD